MIQSGGSHLVLRKPSLGQEQNWQSASWGQRSGSIFPPMYLQYSCWSDSSYWPVGRTTTNFSICCINWLNLSKQSCQTLPNDIKYLVEHQKSSCHLRNISSFHGSLHASKTKKSWTTDTGVAQLRKYLELVETHLDKEGESVFSNGNHAHMSNGIFLDLP